MVNYKGVSIKEVNPGSIAEDLELEPGDILLSINRHKLLDLIDYLMLSSEEELELEVLKKSGEILEIDFEKDPGEPLGLVLSELVFDKIRVCKNHCLFCFVHQLPSAQRASLYIRDDDYRLSFLQGSYITLTNLSESDWQRIEKLHLSPLYISVHATDPQIRQMLLGSKTAAQIIEQLKRLAAAAITVHTQAVLCPGINDGPVLERTISDLAEFWPAVASLAVVPVGLTNHRFGLYDLRIFQADEAAAVLRIINDYQTQSLTKLGTRFVFAADEWYILAGEEFPTDGEYEGYPQLDNGVGLIQWFLTEFRQSFAELLPELQKAAANLVLITGESTGRLWQPVIESFNQNCPGIRLEMLPVRNNFFGPSVNVTGLLGGNDIIKAVGAHQIDEKCCYLIPQITLKQDENIFLDGISLVELKEACAPRQIEVVPTRAKDWLTWIVEKGCVTSGPFSNCNCR
jgi:putative radical SAM enzyme (TIGR03279 family)